MKSNKLISIIIPVYNSATKLHYILDSLLKQTYENLEIVLIDDGSKDNSYKIMEKYAKKDKRIRIYKQNNNGVGYTRNIGITYCNGEYITFCDNDDIVEKDYIESLINANDNDYDIIIGGYTRENYSGKVLFKRKLKNMPISKYIQLACWGKLYKKDFVIKNKLSFLETKIADEFTFNVIGYNLTEKVKILDTTKYHWMFNEESLSNNENKRLNYVDELIKVLTEINEKLDKIGKKDEELVEYFYIRTIIYYILFSCKKVEFEKIDKSYEKMFKWLEEINFKWYKNSYIGIFKNTGELLKIKIVIRVFSWLYRIKIAKTLVKVFSKV